MTNFYHLKNLSPNFENYLKAIGDIERKEGVVRSKEIAKRMKVRPSSVTNALQILEKQGLVMYEPYEPITLTPRGKRMWLILHQKNKTVKDFLIEVLEIDQRTAEEIACTIEHYISAQITERILLLKQFLTDQKDDEMSGLDKLHEYFLNQTETPEKKIRNEIPVFLLSALKPGEKATVYRINADGEIRKRIMDMGLTRGQEIIVERMAPMGDPMEIRIRGYLLSLRKSEAEFVMVR